MARRAGFSLTLTTWTPGSSLQGTTTVRWLDHAHLNGAGCSWAAGEGPPQCSEQSWKNTRAEMSQRLSKCVVKKWKVREQWKVKKHQMVVKGKKKA